VVGELAGINGAHFPGDLAATYGIDAIIIVGEFLDRMRRCVLLGTATFAAEQADTDRSGQRLRRQDERDGKHIECEVFGAVFYSHLRYQIFNLAKLYLSSARLEPGYSLSHNMCGLFFIRRLGEVMR